MISDYKKNEIIKNIGIKSYGLLAKELKLTRNQIAGTIFRHKNPIMFASSPNGDGKNKLGSGYRQGLDAQKNLR